MNRGTLRHAFCTHESEGMTKYCHVRAWNINTMLTFCVKSVENHCWPLRVTLLWNVYISVKCQRKFLKFLRLDGNVSLKKIRVRVDCIYLIQDRIWERAFVNTVTNTWVIGGELRWFPKEDSAPQNMLFKNMKTPSKITTFRISCPVLSIYFILLMASSRHNEGYARKDSCTVQQHCKEWFVIFLVAWDVFVSSVC